MAVRFSRTTSATTRLLAVFGIVGALHVADAHAATYIVGTGSGCTHATLAAAVTSAENNPGADTIRLTRSITYSQVAASITTSQELTIAGGFATCAQATSDGTTTTLDGAGGATEPVLRITGNTGALIRLDTLTIKGGDEDGRGYGGGIYFRGNGILEIQRSTITQNTAGYGGGIYAEGLGTEAELVIGTGVQIVANTARYSGGGVYNEGLEMTMVEPDSWIAANEATGTLNPVTNQIEGGYGGGLMLLSGARSAYTYLGSTGIGNSGPLYLNKARYGGGAAVYSNDNRAELRVFSTNAARPTRIRSNTASVAGGALYGFRNDGVQTIKTWFVFIEDNIAPRGAALWSRSAGGGFGLDFNLIRLPGSVDCPVGSPCGGIIGNVAENDTGQMVGGIIEIGGYAFPRFHRMTFQGNRGRHLYLGDGSYDGGLGFETHHVTITGNEAESFLIATADDDGSTFLNLHDTTIAGNTIGAPTVIRINNVSTTASSMERSIIWQPGKTVLQNSGPVLRYLTVIANEVGSLTGSTPEATVYDPRFVDPARGDFSLRAASPAVDAAPTLAGDTRDRNSRSREVDLPFVQNRRGPRDLGAIERQAIQPLVLNGDFDADANLWPAISPISSWVSDQNAAGTTGSGSILVSTTNFTPPRVFARSQCVHLPGPGRYRLNGYGRGGAGTPATRDAAYLYWELRHDGGEPCNTGAPNASGYHFLGSGSGWNRPASPAVIDLTAAQWRYTSSINVVLVVQDNGVTGQPNNSATAWFDGITLEIEDGDIIFQDDFDP